MPLNPSNFPVSSTNDAILTFNNRPATIWKNQPVDPATGQAVGPPCSVADGPGYLINLECFAEQLVTPQEWRDIVAAAQKIGIVITQSMISDISDGVDFENNAVYETLTRILEVRPRIRVNPVEEEP